MAPSPLNLRQRLHAFLAIGLAVFLLSLTAVGLTHRGFQFSATAAPLPAIPDAAVTQSETELQTASTAYQQAREKTIATLDRYQAANARLRDFLDDSFAKFAALEKQASDKETAIEQPSAQPPATVPPPPASQQQIAQAPPAIQPNPLLPNPLWIELNQRVNELQSRRLALLQTLQPDHPTIQAVDLSIADANSQLNRTPKQILDPSVNVLPAPTNQTANQSPAQAPTPQAPIAPPPAANSQISLAAIRETDDQFRALSEQVTSAQTECQSAMSLQNSAWRKKTQAELDHAAALAARSAADKLAATQLASGGANLRHSLLASALLALACGLVVAIFARPSEPIFRSAAQIRQQLGLTILGLIPFSPFQSAHEKPRRQPRWIRRSILFAELCVAAIVLLLAVTALADKHFLNNLLANPLAACSQKFFC